MRNNVSLYILWQNSVFFQSLFIQNNSVFLFIENVCVLSRFWIKFRKFFQFQRFIFKLYKLILFRFREEKGEKGHKDKEEHEVKPINSKYSILCIKHSILIIFLYKFQNRVNMTKKRVTKRNIMTKKDIIIRRKRWIQKKNYR